MFSVLFHQISRMEQRSYSKMVQVMQYYCVLMLLMVVCFAEGDLAKDREKCGNELAGLVSCLPYVGGDSKAPTKDCCSGLQVVLKDSKICLCILVRDRNDPDLGLKINATLALRLPDTCHSTANITECPSLLHLKPGSPDAKVFEDFAKNNHPLNTTSPPASGKTSGNGSSASLTSDGGSGENWIGVKMAFWVSILVVFSVELLHN